ncbi:RNA polymerase subunit sigma-70 [Sphingomonas oleivorans]|uniref:RNA polymerase subunit sigma-70 n=1 Tax=Sphingomonas oleivorans TaxID=1735121 RepID=A0A2T5G293_9SPHN|nr:sigma-70 family RNA polymerase sigma factor [Sphingomonas oleivorans]PTQ13273.1 RNA polymerase subunit sigma-70 [Sphingomonas oleivorans]
MDDLTDRLAWFKTVILPHQRSLRGRLRLIAPAGFDLDDLVAETLARAYAVEDWRRITKGRAYLFTIARNLLMDFARREAVVSFDFVADLDMLQIDHSTEAALSARDELRQLQRIIDGLPPQCRNVFLLRRVHERSLGEIAEEMGLSVSTVEKHLAKAVMLVTRAMAESEDSGVERSFQAPGRAAEDRRGGRPLRR